MGWNEWSPTGQTQCQDHEEVVRIAHACGMFITWCILFPLSIFIVRYYKHHHLHLKVHRFLQLTGGISISSFGSLAIATYVRKVNNHYWVALTVFSLSFVLLGSGLLITWGQNALVSINKGYPRFIKRFHQISGITLVLLAWVNIYLGMDAYNDYYKYDMTWIKIAFGCWIFIVIACFVFCELQWKYELGFKLFYSKDENINEKKSMIHPHICVEDFNKLPTFTWKEFNQRVQSGANFVVCDGLIVDVHKWIHSHPGGSHIIKRVIGSDITNDFYNRHQNISVTEEFDAPDVPLLSTEESQKKNSMIYKYIYHLQGRYTTQGKNTFATIIDILNSKYYLKVPIAQHTHSRLATQKMASMVIGKIEKAEDDHMSDKLSLTTSYDSRINSPTNDGNELLSSIEHIKFHRYKLTSKAMVNVNETIPVMRFTLTKIYQHKNDNNERFYPGSYVELFAKIKGQMVTRKYCPLEGTISKSFTIYVKAYPTGLLSKHLNKQLLGYEILVRGPFDIKLSPYIETLSFTTRGSLLNPNSIDGCWNELYMIAGGTGVTPMLQLIKYHLEQSATQTNVDNYRMNLLYANDTVEDIIDGILLEDLALTSRGQLTVTYCLSNPPEEWKGLSGIIDSNLISEWLSKMRCESYPSLYEQRSSLSTGNIFLSNSVRNIGYNDMYNIKDDQKNSRQSFTSSLSQVNKMQSKKFYTTQSSMRSSQTSLQLDKETSDDINNNRFPLQKEVSKKNSQLSINLNTLPSSLRTGDLQKSTSRLSLAITNSEDDAINIENEIESTIRESSPSRGISPLFYKNSGTNFLHRKIVVCGPNGMVKVVEHALYNMGYNENNMILLYS